MFTPASEFKARIQCFNVAASIKMRKLDVLSPGQASKALLQCGRIYKDAEILSRLARASAKILCFNVAASIKMRKFLYDYANADASYYASMWPHL